MSNGIKLEFTINEDQKSGVLRLCEDLNIQMVADLKEVIIDAIKYVDNCVLDLENVTSCDLSCMQILYSAVTTAKSTGKQINLLGKCPAIFQKAVTDLGFSHLKWFGSGEKKL